MQFKGRSIVDLQALTAEKVVSAPSAVPQEITALKPGLRDPSRVNVYVNHKFLCSLSLLQFNQAELKLHQILTDADCERLVGLSNYGKLYQRALEWACVRPRSEKEARTYLINKQRRRDLDWRRYEAFLVKYRSDPEFKAKVDADRERVRNLNERARSTDFTENNTFECFAKFRYRQPDNEVTLEYVGDDILVKYPQKVKSVTPGQACVFYLGEQCLGGGIIKEVRKNNEKLWYL